MKHPEFFLSDAQHLHADACSCGLIHLTLGAATVNLDLKGFHALLDKLNGVARSLAPKPQRKSSHRLELIN